VLFQVRNASWTLGATYYILFGSGTASGTAFCGPESAPITGILFIYFYIDQFIFRGFVFQMNRSELLAI